MEGERKGEERRWKKGGKSVGTRKRELIPSGRRPLHKVIVVHLPLKLDEGKFKD